MSLNANYLKALELAIFIAHKCTPTHRETVFVREKTRENETVWEGSVEAFDVAGIGRVKTCYAWQHLDCLGTARIVTVLENGLIDSASKAVQAAIFNLVQPVKSSTGLELLKCNLMKSEKILHQSQIRSEDLSAAIESAEEIVNTINQKHAIAN